MLNGRYAKDSLDSNRNIVRLHVRVPIGSSGAPGTHVGRGIVVTRTGTGAYTATIQHTRGGVGAILGASVQVVSATRQHATIASAVASTGVVTFVTVAATAMNTAADPGSGDHLLVAIQYRNSSSDRS